MPKLSVSVPDELWEEARAAAKGMGPSELVQDALRRMVGDRQLPYSGAPPADDKRLRRIHALKRAEVDELFRSGYEDGLRTAETYEWEFLDLAASFDFNLERLRLENERRSEIGVYWELEEILPNLGLRGRVYDEGLRRALRDAWQAVLSEERPEEPRSDEAAGEAGDGAA